MTDEQIINAIRHGGQEMEKAFNFLVKNEGLQKSIYGLLYRMGAQVQDIPDVIQEGLIIFYRNVITGKFKRESRINTYIVSICKFQWLNQQKKTNTYSNTVDIGLELADEMSPEAIFFQKEGLLLTDEVKISLRKVIDQLGEDCQKALSMWSENQTMKSIQKEFGYGNIQSANNRVQRCKDRLKKLIKAQPRLANFLKSSIS